MKSTAVHQPTTPGEKGEQTLRDASKAARVNFVGLALNMTWQLALVVLVPIILCVQIGKAVHAVTLLTYVGLALAILGSILVMWRAMQLANRLPVPKLSEAQRRAIQKSYDEEDDD